MSLAGVYYIYYVTIYYVNDKTKNEVPLLPLSLSLSAVLSGHLIKIADALDESALCLRMTRARSAERSDCVRLMLQVCDRLVDVCSDVLDAVGDGWALVCLP